MTRSSEQPIFEPSPALPRGPHSLSREQVAASQRTRLLAAMTELLAERGYAGVTIGELARRAGVSRAAFYEHFADKEACLLAAYDRFAERVLAALAVRIELGTSWSEFIEATLAGYLGALEHDLTAARAFIVEMDAAGPDARRRRRQEIHAFAARLADRHADIRAGDPSLGPLSPTAYLTLALGVREFVHDLLESGERTPLTDYAPDLLVLVTAAIAGAAAAATERP